MQVSITPVLPKLIKEQHVPVTQKAAVQLKRAQVARAHLINGGVMLRETEHSGYSPGGGSLQKRSEILLPARCGAEIRMTAMRQWDPNLTRKGRINEASAAPKKIPPLLDS